MNSRNLLQHHKVNVLTLVPPIMVFLAKSPLFEQYDLSTVKGKFLLIYLSNTNKLFFSSIFKKSDVELQR